jgi:membrane-bound lytic murein transglycosylase B
MRPSSGFSSPSPLLGIVFLSALIFVVSAIVLAVEPPDDFNTWLKNLQLEALASGISRPTVDAALTDLKPIEKVVALDRNQPEAKLTLAEYLDRVVPATRIEKGRRLLQDNRLLLEEISQQYGVQPHFLVALWGIETDFGRITGDFPVIGALATLAYDNRRSDFFRRECLAALRLVDSGMLQLSQMKGSWAGAMGEMQFLPSVFARYAVDYDGNGRIDVWQDRGDIFASAANYLRAAGWQGMHGWGYEIALPHDFRSDQVGISWMKTVIAWQALGIRRQDGRPFPEDWGPASIIQPDGPAGRSFLVFNNYHVLLTWNRSHQYAIGVGLLADQLRSAR